MDPPVEHSFLRFSRGRVSLLSPPRLQPSLHHGRGQCTPVFASFASTKIRTMDLPGLFDYHLSFSSSLFFLPFFPLHSSSSTPPLSFPNNISRCLSFSSPHPTHPLFLSLSLYPPSFLHRVPPSNPPSRTMKPKIFSWHLGNAGAWLPTSSSREGRQAFPPLSLSLRPSYRNGRLLCVVVHGEGGRREAIDRRFRRSTLARFLDRVRCFGDMQTRKRGKSPSLSGKNFFQAIFRDSFFSKKSFEQRFSCLLSLLFFFLLQLLQFVWNDSIDEALFQRKLDIIIFHFFSNQSTQKKKRNEKWKSNRRNFNPSLRSKDRISEGR